MTQNVYDLLWFFLFYSFLGWVIGTVAAAMRKHRFVDVGFLYGPWCPSYGIGGLMIAIFLQDLRNQLFFLFLGGAILSFLVSLATGFLLERIFHRKWWDYSRKRFQFGGYVNLPYVVVWGAAGVVCISFVNPALRRLFHLIPRTVGEIILWILLGIMLLDYIGTVMGVLAVKSRLKKATLLGVLSENLQNTADLFGEGLTGLVLRHLGNASSELEAKKLLEARQARERELEAVKAKSGIFAVFVKIAVRRELSVKAKLQRKISFGIRCLRGCRGIGAGSWHGHGCIVRAAEKQREHRRRKHGAKRSFNGSHVVYPPQKCNTVSGVFLALLYSNTSAR